VHLGDRELGRRIDTRECLSVDDDIVNHEPDFDVVGRNVAAVTRDGMAFPPRTSSDAFSIAQNRLHVLSSGLQARVSCRFHTAGEESISSARFKI
jgi:hypothetical protein